MTVWRPRWGWVLDWVVVPAGIIWLAFEPNFPHGLVDYFEAGQYLGPINGIFHGEIPFRDNFTLWGPLFLYIPAWIMFFFGKTIAVLRAYFHVTAILNVLASYFVGRLICQNRFFRYLIPLLFLMEVYHPFWSTRYGGFRVGLGLLILGCLIRYVQRGSQGYLVLAGFLSGSCLLYSTDVGLLCIWTTFLLALWLWFHRMRSPRVLRGDCFGYLFAMGLSALPFVAYFAIQGALLPYLETAFWVLPQKYPQAWLRLRLPSLLSTYQHSPSLLAFISSDVFKIYLPCLLYGASLIYLAVRGFARSVTEKVTLVMLFVAYGLPLYIAAFRSIYGPQFQNSLPSLIILIAFCAEECFRRLEEAEHKRIQRGMPLSLQSVSPLCVLLICAGYFLISEKRFYRTPGGWLLCQRFKTECTPYYLDPVWISMAQWSPLRCERSGGIRVPSFQAEEMDGVTRFLLDHTAPQEAVFTFPEHGIFNFLADRPILSRFHIAGYAWAHPEWRRELLEVLHRQSPRFVVMGKSLSHLARSLGREEELLPEVIAFLRENYRVVRSFSTVEILERKEGMLR